MLPMPVVRSVPFQDAALIVLKIGKQVSVSRLLDLLLCHAEHGFTADFSFMRLRILSVEILYILRLAALTAVKVVIDLRTVIAVHRGRRIEKRRQQICLDITNLCCVVVDTVKDIFKVHGIDF